MLYFSEINYRGNHAGTKARNDAEEILRQYGARPVNTRSLELRDTTNSGIRSNIANRLGFIRYFWDLLFVRNETVIIQYPMLAFDIQKDYIQFLSRYNRVVFLIHDIQSLRRENHTGLNQEIEMLNLAFGLIVHNRFMEEKLKEIGITVNHIYHLNCFDYLFSGTPNNGFSPSGVAFAGNLEKSDFLPTMCNENPTVPFYFFGPGWNSTEGMTNATYCGSFLPDDIPGKLQGTYGLIWDGKTTVDCSGAVGEYTRINNPHKLSLYIAAGIPVIAWCNAAIAEFIQKNQIGVVVERIDNLQHVLSDISDEQYAQMQRNILNLRSRVIQGKFLQAALCQIEEDLSRK